VLRSATAVCFSLDFGGITSSRCGFQWGMFITKT
jgi:hypothetical protein